MRDRHRLPQLDAARPFLADGGLETTLIFHRGLDLPCFATFALLGDETGRNELLRHQLPPRGGHRPGLDGLWTWPRRRRSRRG